ncbi:MAG: NAD-dependent epimerase/dehydratase family protein [Actinomycetota bacterium]
MGKRAFVLGGSGFVGRHVARCFADYGWDVTIGSRGETVIPSQVGDIKHVALDRRDDSQFKRALGAGVDVLIDVIPYELRDVQQLLDLRDRTGSVIAISSASVYEDAKGHSLDTIRTGDYPDLPNPIPESQRTVAVGDESYSTKKAAIEEMLLHQGELLATVIRPCAIYGPGDTLCREWFFVKRALDRRPQVVLAYEGRSVFHTSSVRNVAELIRLAAENPGTRVFNCGDPDPPDVLRISRSIARAMGHEWDEILVPADDSEDPRLRNPWRAPRPLIVDMTKAEDQLGYKPVVTYDEAIAETVAWIRSVATPTDWKHSLPRAAEYLGERFDYDAEDAFVREWSA